MTSTNFKLLADITWTGWSSFDELRIKFDNALQADGLTTEDWDDSFRYSIGVDWQYNQKITLRSGIAYDETPVPSAERRTPRVPGNSRTWLSFGGTYVIDDEFTIDIGYSHLCSLVILTSIIRLRVVRQRWQQHLRVHTKLLLIF